MFADDICVFSPSISGLQCLLDICGDYAAEHESLAVTKQLVFLFTQKSINNLPHQIFSKWCTCTIFRPGEISWCVDKCIIEG